MNHLLVAPYSSLLIYLAVFVTLFILELIYFRIAEKYDIIDHPNGRSSHTRATIIGGGVIFWFAAVLYVPLHISAETIWFFVGVTLIAFVSFIDDLISLGAKRRLVVHFMAISCAFIATEVFNLYPWWAIIISYFVFIGIINVYNFMDGINGITSLYTISVLLSLQYVNLFMQPFVLPDLIWYPLIACVVLLTFNFREHAKCFPGDVGSITIAFWIVSLFLLLTLKTNNLVWFGFLMVYGVDGVGTIVHRIYLRENIMRPHRIHFFQILSNERGIAQRKVSLIYFGIQLIVSALLIWLYPIIGWWVFAGTLLVLLIAYGWKFKLMKQYGLRVYRWEEPTTVYND